MLNGWKKSILSIYFFTFLLSCRNIIVWGIKTFKIIVHSDHLRLDKLNVYLFNEDVSQLLTVQWQINGICIKCAISFKVYYHFLWLLLIDFFLHYFKRCILYVTSSERKNLCSWKRGCKYFNCIYKKRTTKKYNGLLI